MSRTEQRHNSLLISLTEYNKVNKSKLYKIYVKNVDPGGQLRRLRHYLENNMNKKKVDMKNVYLIA